MPLLDTLFGNSYQQDLTQMQSLCSEAILSCEMIRPCYKKDKEHISADDISDMEKRISEILQKAREIEQHWGIKFNAKLTSFASAMESKKVFIKTFFSDGNKPHHCNFTANNALLNNTEEQFSVLLKEVNSELHKTEEENLSDPDDFLIPF